MKSSSQKTFKSLRTVSAVTAVLVFVLILYPALSFAVQVEIVQAIYGGTINVEINEKCPLGATM